MFYFLHVHFDDLRLTLFVDSLSCERVPVEILEKFYFLSIEGVDFVCEYFLKMYEIIRKFSVFSGESDTLESFT